MAQKRVLILDEDALVLVVNKDVVHQVDDKRGELTRSEFINFLIQSQLKDGRRSHNYVEKEEFHHLAQEMKETMRSFLDFILGWALEQDQKAKTDNWDEWFRKVQAMNITDPESKDS